MSLRPAAVLIAAALAACQPGATPSSPPSSVSTSVLPSVRPSPRSAASASPVALASGPLVSIRFVGDSPVVTRADGPAGHDAVLPAAGAVDADGSLVAFLVWFGKARGD